MKKINVTGTPDLLNGTYEIVYEGKAFMIQNTDRDPYGDGSGTSPIWLTEAKWNQLIKNGSIRTNETIDVSDFNITYRDNEWWVDSRRYAILVAGPTPDIAVEKAKMEISRWK